MSAHALLTDLRSRGIAVRAEGTELLLDGPQDVLTEERCATIAHAKCFGAWLKAIFKAANLWVRGH